MTPSEHENLIIEDENDIDDDIIEKEINEIKELFQKAKFKKDYDFILDKFNIKIKKKGKLRSCKPEKMNIKRLVISMRFNEPDDYFDYDFYSAKNL